MEIVSSRRWRADHTTTSSVTIDGKAQGFILEDRDRGLKQTMPLEQIVSEKIYGRTAIPAGRYRVDITFSNRFKRELPILLNVPGFSGIRIHPGNRHVDTEGCLLPGKSYWKEDNEYVVGTSRTASADLQFKIANALKRGEEVWITILTDYQK